MGKITILFILGRLEPGGAERQLITLLKGIDKERFQTIIVTYYGGGRWEEKVNKIQGVRSHSLNLSGRLDLLKLAVGVNRLVFSYKPEIIFGLMGDACTVSLLGRLRKGCKLVWGLRASNMDFSQYSHFSNWIYHLNARLSRFTNVIVSNSWSGRRYHAENGYKQSKIIVIPNGIDTDLFSPCPERGKMLRKSLGIQDGAHLIGRVARLDPMKDFPTFLKMASLLSKRLTDVYFLIAGSGNETVERKLKAEAVRLGIVDRLFFLGHQEDMSSVYSACDITCSTSLFGEGFPNAVAESMACETLCVATDVGDTIKILGEEGGIIVPAKNPHLLAEAACRLLSMPDEVKRPKEQAARKRIVEHFSVNQMVKAYEKLFLSLSQTR